MRCGWGAGITVTANGRLCSEFYSIGSCGHPTERVQNHKLSPHGGHQVEREQERIWRRKASRRQQTGWESARSVASEWSVASERGVGFRALRDQWTQ